MTPRHFGRYQVLHKLGQGTMSAVFLAKDPYLSRLVAVKVLHPDLMLHKPILERFFKEAKTVSRLPSPHIVGVHDLGLEGSVPYLVMEFIDGQTLQKVMYQLQGKPMDPIVACAMLAQVLDGLAVASAAGIVHRDIKPENLMLTQAGYVKLTDFGICHVRDHAMTATGQVLGPPRFMSPEQVLGLKPITPQSDLFSVGVVFYYLLSGKAPFAEESKAALFRQIVEEPHPSLSEVRPGLDRTLVRWVDTLLEKDPARRGPGPAALSLQLKKYLLKRKIAAPVDRIGRYVRELNAAGFQTASDLPAEQVREWMGSLNLNTRPGRFARRKGIAVALGLFLLGATVGGWKVIRHPRALKESLESVSSVPVKRAVANIPPRESDRSSTGVSFSKEPEKPTIRGSGRPSHSSESFSSESRPNIKGAPTGEDSSFLSIASVPPFAEVFLDGLFLGHTPLEAKQIQSGRHHFILKSQMGKKLDTLIRVEPGPQILRFVLYANPEVAP